MSVVHVNSISGITSITSPSSSDVLTLHTSNNAERLRIKSDGNIEVSTATDTAAHYLKFNANRSNDGDHLGGIYGVWNGNSVGAINILAGADTTNKDDGHLQFITYAGGTAYERLRIASDGKILMGVAANNGPAAPLHIYGLSLIHI